MIMHMAAACCDPPNPYSLVILSVALTTKHNCGNEPRDVVVGGPAWSSVIPKVSSNPSVLCRFSEWQTLLKPCGVQCLPGEGRGFLISNFKNNFVCKEQ